MKGVNDPVGKADLEVSISVAILVSLVDFTICYCIAKRYSNIWCNNCIPCNGTIIIVPSFLIVVNYRMEPQWFTPWICKSAGIFLVVVADSWFALFVVTSLTNELWPSTMIIASRRLIIEAGLLWSIVYLHQIKLKISTPFVYLTNQEILSSSNKNTQEFYKVVKRLTLYKPSLYFSFFIFFHDQINTQLLWFHIIYDYKSSTDSIFTLS